MLLENIGQVMQTLRQMSEQSVDQGEQEIGVVPCNVGAQNEVSSVPASIGNSLWSEEEGDKIYRKRTDDESWLEDWRELSHGTSTCTRQSALRDVACVEGKEGHGRTGSEEGKWVWNGGDFVWIC